ncbi:MAG: cytochrome C oxidase subunit IV family protein [Verrucomicrobiae bacterium]|nr:cytochrome C oxidase subunit IV family protein [Verrucomicrobiae bacterium]MDW8309825.1 cytochrome C oxidase subunit IV family protein [Verrucomicrobiales bacterium]
MSESPEHVSRHVRGYLIVGAALLIGTVLTVWASYIDLGHQWNIVLALIIASAKASLVALFFMHLISERQMIYLVLGFTAFFFAGLMALTIGAYHDFPPFTVTR